MIYLEQFQLNIYAFLILALIETIISVRTKVDSYGTKILEAVIICGLIAIVVEPLSILVLLKHTSSQVIFVYFMNNLLFLIAPGVYTLLLIYVEYHLFRSRPSIQKRWVLSLPTIITLILVTINVFYPIYFSIDLDENVIVFGRFIWVHYLIVFLIYLHIAYRTFKHRARTSVFALHILIIFLALPFIGMWIHYYNQYLYFTWPFSAISVLMLYMFLESSTGEKDFMSDLFNRRSYEKYVSQLVEMEKSFTILFVDIDNFKEINDTFGHLVGDQIIIDFSRVLKKTFLPNQMIARLGGDEYIIVLEYEIDINQVVQHIYKNLKNEENPLVKNIRFSYGHQEFDSNTTIDLIYATVDSKMYEFKRLNKKLNRRTTD